MFIGGIMQRLIRLCVLMAFAFILSSSSGYAQKTVKISGRIAPGDVRIFVKDSIYTIEREYVVGGTLIIEPGTVVYFHPNGRLIDSTGGRIIADGFAEATYTGNPHGIDPLGIAGTPQNPYSWTGYADIDYFLFDGNNPPDTTVDRTIDVNTVRDRSVHPNKYNYLFNVVLNRTTRQITELNPLNAAAIIANPNLEIITFEEAIMFVAGRLNQDPNNDVNLNVKPWSRLGGHSVNVVKEKIRFVGQPINNVSVEWGHIIVLPGARSAFFRNASFENFKKDTTVDGDPIYFESGPNSPWVAVNKKLNLLTNGSGGAITTFSSRTWLLDVEFTGNTARFRGGALQLLQAPAEIPATIDRTQINSVVGTYAANKNPNITDRDGSTSLIIEDNPIPAIDLIDEAGAEPLNDYARMAHDDGRLALYLGRMRNLTFRNNKVQLANYGQTTVGNPPVKIVSDLLNEPAMYPQVYGNTAFGGAVYMSGAEGQEYRKIDVGFGINNSIMIGGTEVDFHNPDTFTANGNEANNYQANGSSFGARGGAIYAGRYTSLQVAGHFEGNKTAAKYLTDETVGSVAGLYSMGGAIFVENSLNRLFVKGGPARESDGNPTRFAGNSSGAGGAIYVDGNSNPVLTTIIGGSDALLETRDYGFDIQFNENSAISWGGAIYSKRQGSITGAGGINANELIGYGGKFPIRFEGNSAGYAGGAVHFQIPISSNPPYYQRAVQLSRALFANNTVGMNIADKNLGQLRGGGAVYSNGGDLNLVKGVHFVDNTVYNGNGGAVSMVEPFNLNRRYFVSDADYISYDSRDVAVGMSSRDDVFTYSDALTFPPDSRMLTQFKGNQAIYENRASGEMGSGATQFAEGVFRTRSQLLSTKFTSNLTGYAVGLFGTIVKFKNGGEVWEYPTSNTNHRLTDVEFVNSNTGYIVGAQGIMKKTTDAGSTWFDINTNTLNQFNDFYSIGQNDLYAVTNNGLIYESHDAGATWTTMQPQQQNLNGVYYGSLNSGFVVGDDKLILRTTDGGTTWEEVVPPIPNYDLTKIFFTSVSKGFIIGEKGTLLSTTDGGDSWHTVASGTAANLTEIEFTSSNNGFITTVYGDIITTTDGGATWNLMEDVTRFGLHGIHFASNSVGYAVGDYGTLLKTEDGGATWNEVNPTNAGHYDVARMHPGTNLPENGVGLGGALYILDNADVNQINRTDSVSFNRVRILNNTAYTGAAIYSDNFDLKLIFGKSLISANTALSDVGVEQNTITGPIVMDGNGGITSNEASSDLASAVIYGEMQGPLPVGTGPVAGNSVYGNNARFIVRLPDAPNTKGVLAGNIGLGLGGTNPLNGNFWGRTQANVTVDVNNDLGYPLALNETFFIAGDSTSPLPFVRNSANLLEQGPFESIFDEYTYTPILLENASGDENTPSATSINEKMLMSGKVYDLYDKGTDIKTADYSKRIMSPIEDFAVGIPYTTRRFVAPAKPSDGKYVRRTTRDPYCVGLLDDNGNLKFPYITALQSEFMPDNDGNFYHPIGYPLYLESHADYDGFAERSNHIPETTNETVFFIINETTGDFIRTNLQQVSETAPYREVFRSRVEFVPDSTNRNPNTLYRRTSEGLFNFGAGFSLLAKLEDNAYNEVGAAVPGRKYEADFRQLGKVSDLYSNRPPINDPNNITEDIVTYFAGERYEALPVDTGDVIRVVSRQVLWKEGVIAAYDDGLEFKIVRATLPPEFTGNIVDLQNDTIMKLVPSLDPIKRANNQMDTIYIDDFTNRIFVTEDRTYPGNYADGRDSILAITAVDSNNFYDPRALADGDNYTYLTYTWDVASNSGLANWLQADTIYSSNPNNMKDEANGYVVLKGHPVNPYVVPGGEKVAVSAANYPPHYRTLDSMVASGLFTQEQIDKFIETYGPYFNAGSYDVDRARYLQQDTIDVAGANGWKTEYEFELFVVDQPPVYLDENYTAKTLFRYESDNVTVKDTIAVYEPTVLTCGKTNEDNPRLRANVTDKLRFQIDINTDDEIEDAYAASEHGWDFRYGRTAYGFMNKIISAGDTVVIDTVTISNEDGGTDTFIDQERPIWMADKYLYRYDDETTKDALAADFTTFGKLNFRIDRAEVETLLEPLNRQNEEYNTDTAFVFVVNDGHGGRIEQKLEVFVNFAPTITTQSLDNAVEGFDYNYQLLDTARGIKVKDPNFHQEHTYELIYSGRGDIAKDPCYAEAGVWAETFYGADGYTPAWLKINPESGILYGTPEVGDALKDEKVIVLVTDEDGLPDLKIFDLRVEASNRGPVLALAPDVDCIDPNSSLNTDNFIYVVDKDFERDPSVTPQEKVTLVVEQPASGVELDQYILDGATIDNDSVKVNLIFTADIANVPVDADGRITVQIKATDAEGETTIMRFRLKLSDPTYFTAPVTVTNSIGAFQVLEFGIAESRVSTGDGRDGEDVGKLDHNYCEYELPPYPQQDVFDARWTLPTINGILRSIYPVSGDDSDLIYVAQIQAGGESGQTAINYPVTISWDITTVPDATDKARNPQGSTWYLRDPVSDGSYFHIKMSDPSVRSISPTYATFNIQGNIATLTITDATIKAFVIYNDVMSDVEDTQAITTNSITNVSPNPVNGESVITFNLNKAANVEFELIDEVGKVVGILGSDFFTAGEHTLNWNSRTGFGSELSSGAYSIRMNADGNTDFIKVMIVK